jgi:hypothetical protein
MRKTSSLAQHQTHPEQFRDPCHAQIPEWAGTYRIPKIGCLVAGSFIPACVETDVGKRNPGARMRLALDAFLIHAFAYIPHPVYAQVPQGVYEERIILPTDVHP